jgi:hypothetical protein
MGIEDEDFDDYPSTHLDDEDYDDYLAREFDEGGGLRDGPQVTKFIVLAIVALVVVILLVFL